MNTIPVGRTCLLVVAVITLMGTSPKALRAQSCCTVPTGHVTISNGRAEDSVNDTYKSRFSELLSDVAHDDFAGRPIFELDAAPGTNSCYWTGSGLPQFPIVSGGNWSVGIYILNDGTGSGGATNKWGYDYIGATNTTVSIIRNGAASNGITLPCIATIYQMMVIDCDALTAYWYETDTLTITIYSDHVVNCRAGNCQTITD